MMESVEALRSLYQSRLHDLARAREHAQSYITASADEKSEWSCSSNVARLTHLNLSEVVGKANDLKEKQTKLINDQTSEKELKQALDRLSSSVKGIDSIGELCKNLLPHSKDDDKEQNVEKDN